MYISSQHEYKTNVCLVSRQTTNKFLFNDVPVSVVYIGSTFSDTFTMLEIDSLIFVSLEGAVTQELYYYVRYASQALQQRILQKVMYRVPSRN